MGVKWMDGKEGGWGRLAFGAPERAEKVRYECMPRTRVRFVRNTSRMYRVRVSLFCTILSAKNKKNRGGVGGHHLI